MRMAIHVVQQLKTQKLASTQPLFSAQCLGIPILLGGDSGESQVDVRVYFKK